MATLGKQRTVDTRRIASLDVSAVGLGCNNFGWKLDEQATAAVVRAALDAGITFFDTADIYGDTKSEVFLGRALGTRRDDVVIATKFGMAVDDHLGEVCQQPGGAVLSRDELEQLRLLVDEARGHVAGQEVRVRDQDDEEVE